MSDRLKKTQSDGSRRSGREGERSCSRLVQRSSDYCRGGVRQGAGLGQRFLRPPSLLRRRCPLGRLVALRWFEFDTNSHEEQLAQAESATAVEKLQVLRQRALASEAYGKTLWELALQHSRKQVFCPDELIHLFLVNICGNLCECEDQHPACGRDRVGEKFTVGNLDRHREFARHLCVSQQVFHLPWLTNGGLLLWSALVYGRLPWRGSCRPLWGSSCRIRCSC